VFIVMPSGSLIAPDVVELQMSPDDLVSLRERMELDVVSTSLTEVYEDRVAERGARFAGSCQPEVYIVPDGSVPQGRYRLRQGRPVSARYSPGTRDLPDVPDLMDLQFGYVTQEFAATAQDPVGTGSAPKHGYPEPVPASGYAQPVGAGPSGLAWYEVVDPGRTIMDGAATVMEQIRPAVPVLRLVTGSSVAETSMSGARAGRGPVELMLPDVPTVSREHARFTFSEGRWWVTSQGMNGLFVNGVRVSGKQPLIDGDSIRWGASSDAPLSRIEIG
jgi:FHA domain